MSYQSTHRVRRRSKGSGLFLLAIVLVLGLIAYGGATLWQKAEARGEEAQSSSQQSQESAVQPDEESAESSAEESAPSQPAGESSSTAGGSSGPASSPFENLEGVVVPKGPWVESSYFDDALFVGDSITYGMQLYNTMTNATVIAHTGINPETILTKAVIKVGEETLTVLDAMKRHNPGKIYVMLGANGVAFLPQDTMMDYYGEFIDAIKAQHPDSVLYVQSILPVTAEKSQDEAYSNTRIDEYNLSLMQLCKEKGVHYLNVAEAFKDENGALPTEASPKDGMHFGPTYYAKWFDYLKCHAVS